MTTMQTTTQGLAQNHWRKIKNAPQRLVLCRLMIDQCMALTLRIPTALAHAWKLSSSAYAWRLPILRTSHLLSPRLLPI